MSEDSSGRAAGPTVSVVIAAYNAEGCIARALQSIEAQTYPGVIETIVVDDGSTDATADLIAHQFPRVTCIRQANQRKSGAVNRGVAHARGEFIALLDHDDEWLPHKIERQLRAFELHPGLHLVLTQSICRTPEGHDVAPPSGLPSLIVPSFRDWFSRRAFHWTGAGPTPSSWLFRREVFTQTGGLADLFPVDDLEFLMRLSSLGYSIAILTEPLLVYHVTTAGASRSREGRLQIASLGLAIRRPYDPSASDSLGDMLSPAEYRSLMYREAALRGWWALRHAAVAEACTCFREAAEVAPSAWAALRARCSGAVAAACGKALGRHVGCLTSVADVLLRVRPGSRATGRHT